MGTMEDTLTIITEDTQTIITEDTQTTMEDTQTTMEDTQIIIIIMAIPATMVTAGLFNHKFLVLDPQEVIRIRTLQSHLDRRKSPFLKHVIYFLSNLIVIF